MDLTSMESLIGIAASLVAIIVAIIQTRKPRLPVVPGPPLPPKQPIFEMSPVGTNARGQQVGNKFVVLRGSSARKETTTTCGATYINLRQQLVTQEKLVDGNAGFYIFTDDVSFNSPTAAAAVISGMSISGPTIWQIPETGQTYRQWEHQAN